MAQVSQNSVYRLYLRRLNGFGSEKVFGHKNANLYANRSLTKRKIIMMLDNKNIYLMVKQADNSIKQENIFNYRTKTIEIKAVL